MLRKIEQSDVERVNEIYNKHHSDTFGLPNLNQALDHIVLEENGKILALGAILQLAEALIILDHDLPKPTRVKAIMKLVRVAVQQAREQNVKQLHAFVKSERLVNLLIEGFGFERIQDIPLVLNIGD